MNIWTFLDHNLGLVVVAIVAVVVARVVAFRIRQQAARHRVPMVTTPDEEEAEPVRKRPPTLHERYPGPVANAILAIRESLGHRAWMPLPEWIEEVTSEVPGTTPSEVELQLVAIACDGFLARGTYSGVPTYTVIDPDHIPDDAPLPGPSLRFDKAGRIESKVIR